MGSPRPKGARITVQVKIGSHLSISRLKKSSADFLGLTASEAVSRRGHDIRGAKGTKSYKLLLKKAQKIGGVNGIKTISFPVNGKITNHDFKAYLKDTFADKVGGMVTPDGISFIWDTVVPVSSKSTTGQKQLPGGGSNTNSQQQNLPGAIVKTGSDVISAVTSVAGDLGIDAALVAKTAIGIIGAL